MKKSFVAFISICLFVKAGFSVSAKTQKDRIMKEKVYYKA